jgi:hypothetical protein
MVERLNRLRHVVIGCAIEVHRALGPGLLESAYEESPVNTAKNREVRVRAEFGVWSSEFRELTINLTPTRRYADTPRPPRSIFALSNLLGLAETTSARGIQPLCRCSCRLH